MKRHIFFKREIIWINLFGLGINYYLVKLNRNILPLYFKLKNYWCWCRLKTLKPGDSVEPLWGRVVVFVDILYSNK